MVRKNNPLAWICSIQILQFFHGDKRTRLQPRKQLITILLKRIAIFFLIASPHVRESNTVLDSGFHDVDSTGIPGTRDFSHFRWILFSGFQSLVGFRIPSAACIPNSTILDSRSSDCLTCEDLLNIFPCFLAVTFVSHKT